jgi:hypothetical protein
LEIGKKEFTTITNEDVKRTNGKSVWRHRESKVVKMKEEKRWKKNGKNERRQLREITINKHATAYGQTFISEKKDLHIWLSVHKGKKHYTGKNSIFDQRSTILIFIKIVFPTNLLPMNVSWKVHFEIWINRDTLFSTKMTLWKSIFGNILIKTLNSIVKYTCLYFTYCA